MTADSAISASSGHGLDDPTFLCSIMEDSSDKSTRPLVPFSGVTIVGWIGVYLLMMLMRIIDTNGT